MDLVDTPIDKAGKLLKLRAKQLEKLGIMTLRDLLLHLPFRYEDFSLISQINNVQEGETVTIQGAVQEVKNTYTRRGVTLQNAVIMDDTGIMHITWFNQPYLTKIIKTGEKISLSGKVGMFGNKLSMQSPEYEVITNTNTTIHTGRLVPIYNETRGLTSKWLRRQIFLLLKEEKILPDDYLPSPIKTKYNLLSLVDALLQIHFPESLEQALAAKARLAFDELLLLHLASLHRKTQWKQKKKATPFEVTKFRKDIDAFIKSLPFTLTNAQKKAVEEILQDLTSSQPMNRLLEGDVGSGKTVVSAIAMYATHMNNKQSILMAPTEILAQQHFSTISNLLSPLGVKVDLVTSSTKSIKYSVSSIKNKNQKPKQNTKYKIQNTDVLVGTHALLHIKDNLGRVGLIVIDEQQRFGVTQRALIRQKGENPHLLTMTATPIPRTIALTMYGDLDLSILDEMPKGRTIVKTWLVPPEKRADAYAWIKKQILQTDSQAFIICPFIDESESMKTVKAAIKEFAYLQKDVFPEFSLGLLHGKLTSAQKNKALDDFKQKKHQILVATPVVEVGIDIPNATIIVIEATERFGLAQLHQLRGRVGRGEKQSYCLLFTESKNPQTLQRLKAMETMHVGATLAEMDLQLRGPGEMYGTQQHGRKMLKIASFSDFSLIQTTKKEAEKIFPKLSEFPLLNEKLKTSSIENVSPD